MFDWTAVSAIAAVCALLGGGGGYFFTRGSRETTANLRSDAAQNLAQACLAKLELLTSRLQEHEIKDATAFAELSTQVSETQRALRALESRLMAGMDALGARFENLTERIDRLLEASKPGARRGA